MVEEQGGGRAAKARRATMFSHLTCRINGFIFYQTRAGDCWNTGKTESQDRFGELVVLVLVQ